MIGSNEFRLNLATVEDIVQHYFDTVLFKAGASPHVAGVAFSTQASDPHTLIVRTTPSEAK